MNDLYRYVCFILCHGSVRVNAHGRVWKCVVVIGIDMLVHLFRWIG
jgi:hypothetical protein